MKLQTIVDIKPSPRKIGYEDKILLLGSCFSDEIGRKLGEYYWRTTCNPFGTLYNPLSIAQALQQTEVPELVEWGGLWHALTHHGDFSYPTAAETREAVERSILAMQQALSEATVVIVTFGTAWVYEWNKDQTTVANCHKIPADRFTRRCLTAEEIVNTWQPIIAQYSDKHWIFTVSPIRHLKDGLHANQLSKATLLMAVEHLTAGETVAKPAYFAAYEILMDELRDYRFYADDMVHPSSLAVEYIWQRFAEAYLSPAIHEDMHALHQLWLDRHHTMLHPDTPEAKRFAERLQERTAQLAIRYPWIQTTL